MTTGAKKQANAAKRYEVTHKSLPLSCPTAEMTLWDSHPKVFLPIEKTGKATCPYCGAEFVLTDFDLSKTTGH